MSNDLATQLRITVNGEIREVSSGTTIDALIESLGVRRELVAIEVNRQLVRRSEHANRRLADGDHVEVVEFVGGG